MGVKRDTLFAHFCPQCGQLREFSGRSKVGSKSKGCYHFCGRYPRKPTTTKKKVGVMPRKGAHFEQERKICPLSHP